HTACGAPLAEALNLNDPVLILGLTPNRADCLGLVGVAREVSALTGIPVQMPDNTLQVSTVELPVPEIRIGDKQLCSRYTGLVIKNVTVGPAPVWMQIRLLQAGVRPISNIVDITNYVMWEWGQPLHAFDYRTLRDHTIVVRRAFAGEKLTTLDGTERLLTPEMLVIADTEKAVGLAGVMGGLATEVTEQTDTVLLEAAHFNPVSIRRTGRTLGLYSEAQQRFEKGVDVNGCAEAARRAARLIELLGAGSVDGDIVDRYVAPVAPRKISLRPERARKLLGLEISRLEMANIFRRQGFTVEEGTQLHVVVPTLRSDLQEEVDLIEEVARIYGYDKIGTTLPDGRLTQGRRTKKQRALRKTRELLVACGLSEAICYSFISPRHFDRLLVPQESELRRVLSLSNPLSEEQSVMRTMLLPDLLEAVVYNQNRNEDDIGLFEIGTVFLPAGGALPQEKTTLGLVLTGTSPLHWQQKQQPVDFFALKGIVETLLSRLGIDDVQFAGTELPWCQPGQTAAVFIRGEQAGWLGRIHPVVMDQYELEKPVYAAELDLEQLLAEARLTASYRELPRYPAVLRDMAVVLPETVPAGEIIRTIRAAGCSLVEAVALFDQYRGPQIPAGKRSLAFAVTYRDPHRTLSDEAVNSVHEQIENALATQFGAELRGR
ncbi:MAG TPA: phenylalanine--tRNA ligase subunit beta, partial [Firmicutes bacterium]|nr:phenylalanine--tRNA ligase subunit beta [Bacillota bacterium]